MTKEQDERVKEKAAALDERLRLMEKQAAEELARFPAAPAPKSGKAAHK